MLWFKAFIVMIFLVLGCCQCANWEIMGGGIEHKLPVFRVQPTVRWSISTPNSYSGMALLDDSEVLIGSDTSGNYAFSFSKATGNQIQVFTDGTDAVNTGSLGWDANNVYVFSAASGRIKAFQRATGLLVWSSNVLASFGVTYLYAPLVWDGSRQNFYFSSDSKLYKISAANGTTIWQSSISANRLAIPTYSKIDNTLVLHTINGDLFKFEADTGNLIWTKSITTTVSFVQGQPTIDSQGNIYFGDNGAKVYKYDRDGTNIWTKDTATEFLVGAPILIKNETWFLLVGHNSVVYAVQTSDGTIITGPTLSTYVATQPVASNGVLYCNTNDVKLVAVDYSDLNNMQILWQIATGMDSIGGPSIDTNGDIYLTGTNNIHSLMSLGCENPLFVVTRDGLSCDCPFRSFYDGSTCNTCDPNQFWDINTGCKTCITGLVPSEDQRACIFCDNGYIADVKGVMCEKCPNGTYTNEGDKNCTACPAGKVVNSSLSGCMNCSAGSIPLADQSGCTACPEKTFSNAGDSQCTSCDVEPTNKQCPKPPVAVPIAVNTPIVSNTPSGSVPKAPNSKTSSASSICLSFLSLSVAVTY